MSTRALIIVFILALSLIIFYGAPAVYYFYRNSFLTKTAPVEKAEWSVKPISEEEYRPLVHFSYNIEGKTFEQDELFKGIYYRNPYKAQDAIKELEQEYKTVWYSPYSPANGTLEKYFPTKRAIYSGMLFLLLFYSIWWGRRYLSRISGENFRGGGDGTRHT